MARSPGYRAKPNAILRAAITRGLGPNRRAIARASGLSYGTVKRALAGERVSATTMAALALTLGKTEGQLFHITDSEHAQPSLRVAK